MVKQHYQARLEIDRCEKGKGCCALWLLESEPDFLNEKPLLEIEITRYVVLVVLPQIMAHKLEIARLGHECLFYPKFHCELNCIELFWGAVKRYTRENCYYSFAELEPTVLAGLESVSPRTIQRLANRSRRWSDSYIKGLSDKQRS